MSEDRSWLRRHAIQIVAQLPENTDDACIVLELARELVESFLAEKAHLRTVPPSDVVCTFPTSINCR